MESITGLSTQMGMMALARTAGNVIHCIDRGDAIATAATLARLVRIGDSSLNAVWDIQGLTL